MGSMNQMVSMSGYRMIATLCVILSLLQFTDAKPKAKANPKIYLVDTKSPGPMFDGNDYDVSCGPLINQVKNDYSSSQDYCAFGDGCTFAAIPKNECKEWLELINRKNHESMNE